MNAKGDTELVIAELALSAGVITTQIFSSLIFMAMASTIVSPIILRRLLRKP
jgi:Kef-type K+ transport system membrane component KefB